LADYLPEDKISETKSVIGELMGMHPSIWQLEHQVAEAILQLAHVGRVVLAGRAAYLITQSLPGGFHVKLVAPLETRIPRMMALLGCDAAAAAAHIRKTDRARRRYVKTRFGRDIDDTHLYDLVINTERISPASAASLIVAALRDRLTGLREEMGAETRPAAASVAGR
ncbi:MAG: cytidylate kinase family protein, partial [Opitutaceae bacterium]